MGDMSLQRKIYSMSQWKRRARAASPVWSLMPCLPQRVRERGGQCRPCARNADEAIYLVRFELDTEGTLAEPSVVYLMS